MNSKWMARGFVAVTLGALTLAACNGGGTGSNAACEVTTDCTGNEVCVRVGSDAACTTNCTANVDACGADASCAGVGSVGVSVCQEKKPEGADPDPKTEPFLPCATDADCTKVAAGTICAQSNGSKDCSIPCTQDSQCNPAPVNGVSTAFFACKPDESNMARTVCLPRQECFDDPTSCLSGLPSESTGSASPFDFGGGF